MADHSGIKILQYFLQKLKSFFLSKDILSFLLFLAFSAAMWFVHALDKERETLIEIPVRVVGVPPNIQIISNVPEFIEVDVRDKGMNLLAYSHAKKIPLTIDVSRAFNQKGEFLISSDVLRSRLDHYLQPTTSVIEIHPDTILIQYEKQSLAVLPVKLVADIEPAHQHVISDTSKVEPSTVTVYGPKKEVEALRFVPTERLVLKDVADTVSVVCRLNPIRHIRFSPNKVKVTIFAEQFTEKKIQIPVQSINCPPGLIIRTFPATVSVVYTLGLSHFNSNQLPDIKVYIDYNDVRDNQLSRQKLKIINSTPYISNVRIDPQDVEFLLERIKPATPKLVH